MTKYALSPLASISRTGSDGQVAIHGGSGFDRQRVEIDGTGGGSSAFITWILARSAPATHDELINTLSGTLELPSADADDVVGQLIEAHVLIDTTDADELTYALQRWDAHGWGDAALFHSSTFGQPFDPDTLGDVSYEDYYRSILEDLSTAGPQPPARKPGQPPRPKFSHDGAVGVSVSFADVLGRAAPINRFQEQGMDLAVLLAVLSESFQAQRIIGGTLGEHLLKPYPSGGARHPLEMYVIAKFVSGLPACAYHFETPARQGSRSWANLYRRIRVRSVVSRSTSAGRRSAVSDRRAVRNSSTADMARRRHVHDIARRRCSSHGITSPKSVYPLAVGPARRSRFSNSTNSPTRRVRMYCRPCSTRALCTLGTFSTT